MKEGKGGEGKGPRSRERLARPLGLPAGQGREVTRAGPSRAGRAGLASFPAGLPSTRS